MYSNARNSYYNITGFPTVFFDGVLSVVGGSGTNSMYGTYVPLVDQRNAIPSDFTMEVEFENTGLDYSTTIIMENVGGNTSTNLVLQFTITESHMPIVWGLGEEVNGVNRLMVPDQNGTVLDFSTNTTQTIELDFSLAGFWDVDNCAIIAFIQDNSTKEIPQGTIKYMAVPLYNIDVEAKDVKYPVGSFCGTAVSPVVLIKNMGAENLTSCDIEYSINGGSVQTYNWTGDIAFNLGEEVELDEIVFEPEAVNTFEFMVTNPNGETDPNPENDAMESEFSSAPQFLTQTINFELKTDQYPTETTWEVTNSAGDVLYSGGPYSAANTVNNETWEIEDIDCYTFTIYDEYGDGICCAYGNGYYRLMDEDNEILIEGGQFGSSMLEPFERYGDDPLTADFMASETSIIEGESVDFTDLSAGSITIWYWEFEGGTPATSIDQNPTVTYDVEGVYDVTLTVSDGSNSNVQLKEDYIEVFNATGISTIDKLGVQVFPNPTTGTIYLEGVEDATVKVYNTAGTVVATYSKFNAQTIDLSGMHNGIYFIHITMENEVISKKVNLVK